MMSHVCAFCFIRYVPNIKCTLSFRFFMLGWLIVWYSLYKTGDKHNVILVSEWLTLPQIYFWNIGSNWTGARLSSWSTYLLKHKWERPAFFPRSSFMCNRVPFEDASFVNGVAPRAPLWIDVPRETHFPLRWSFMSSIIPPSKLKQFLSPPHRITCWRRERVKETRARWAEPLLGLQQDA